MTNYTWLSAPGIADSDETFIHLRQMVFVMPKFTKKKAEFHIHFSMDSATFVKRRHNQPLFIIYKKRGFFIEEQDTENYRS